MLDPIAPRTLGGHSRGPAHASGNREARSAGTLPCPGSHELDAATDPPTPHTAIVRTGCRLRGSPLGTRSTTGQTRRACHAARHSGRTGSTPRSLFPIPQKTSGPSSCPTVQTGTYHPVEAESRPSLQYGPGSRPPKRLSTRGNQLTELCYKETDGHGNGKLFDR